MPLPRRAKTIRRRSIISSVGRGLKKTMSVAGTALKAYKLARAVASVINVEHKHVDYTANDVGLGTTGTVLTLTQIAQGDGISNRSGNSVKLTGLNMQFSLQKDPNITDDFVRVMLLEDTQQQADTAITANDVLGAGFNHTSLLNLNTLGRFKVRWNKVFNLNDATRKSMMVKKYFKLNHHVRFNGSATSDIQRGGLYILYFDASASPTSTITYSVRVSFVDN